jgi:hypothetical protein
MTGREKLSRKMIRDWPARPPWSLLYKPDGPSAATTAYAASPEGATNEVFDRRGGRQRLGPRQRLLAFLGANIQ